MRLPLMGRGQNDHFLAYLNRVSTSFLIGSLGLLAGKDANFFASLIKPSLTFLATLGEADLVLKSQ